MITVTKGQWFPLTISNVQYGGADFDLQGAKDVKAALVSSLGTRAELSFTVSAYNELSAVCDGNIAPGKYSVEVTAVGADGRNYRMLSPLAVIEITSSTTPSGASKARIQGDNWELTADVEMHEGQARTYMSLLEEARKKALQAATDAETTIDNVQSSVTQAQEAVKTAQEASTNANNAVTSANKAVSDANYALQSITTMEGMVSTAEQGRKDAESERVTAEQGRKDAESERVTAEQGREKEMSEYMLVIKKPIISTSEKAVIMDANKFYNITIGTILTLDINPPQDTAITNDWEGCFDTNTVAPTVTWPANINWGTSYMMLAINTHYEFSIRLEGGKYYRHTLLLGIELRKGGIMRLNIRRLLMAKQDIPPYIKQCEYIENTNQAFINTEVQGGSNCAYEITFLMRNSQSVQYPQIITSEDHPPFAKICLEDSRIQIQSLREIIKIGNKEEKISVVVNSKEYIVNGKTTAKEASISWGDYDVYLLSENPLSDPPASTLYCKACIYMCKMYTDDVLVRDFIPVYNTQTSEYGMWDKVNRKFYGSANDRKFTGVLLVGGKLINSTSCSLFNVERRAA